MKNETTEEDKKIRRDIAEKALTESKTTPFATVGTKYQDQYENVTYISTSGALIREAKFEGADTITKFPYISPVTYIA
jgi:hypothetical protein